MTLGRAEFFILGWLSGLGFAMLSAVTVAFQGGA